MRRLPLAHRLLVALLAVGTASSIAACSGAGPTQAGPTTSASGASLPQVPPSSPPASSGDPIVRGYTFPGGMIEAAQGGGALYTRVEGVLALPAGAGRHPVVVIVHGSYPGCIDKTQDKLFSDEIQTIEWPEGCPSERLSQEDGLTTGPDYVRAPASLAYLADELARRGFAVVIPDVATKERLDWGGEPDAFALQTNVTTLHLDLLRRLDAGEALGLAWEADLKGRLDTTSVALVGHSSGAGYVLAAGLAGTIPGTHAVVSLEPALKTVPNTPGRPVPTLAVIGQCDEQIPRDDSESDLKDLAQSHPEAPILSLVLDHATHIDTLVGGGSSTIGLVTPSTDPACAPGALLSAPVQQAAMAHLTADFIAQTYAGTRAYALGLVPGASASAAVISGGATVTTAPTSARSTITKPTAIAFTSSTKALLPEKPASLVLNRPHTSEA